MGMTFLRKSLFNECQTFLGFDIWHLYSIKQCLHGPATFWSVYLCLYIGRSRFTILFLCMHAHAYACVCVCDYACSCVSETIQTNQRGKM